MQKVQPASFADLLYREKKKQTRREKFLAQMDVICRGRSCWSRLSEAIPRDAGDVLRWEWRGIIQAPV